METPDTLAARYKLLLTHDRLPYSNPTMLVKSQLEPSVGTVDILSRRVV